MLCLALSCSVVILLSDGVRNTPLTPLMGPDWLACRHLYVCGRAVESTGFRYLHPVLTEELLRDSLREAVQCGTFPASCYKEEGE